MGHSMSRTRKRLPRLTSAYWAHILKLMKLSEKANCVLHTDGGDSNRNPYASVQHSGIVAKAHVNHNIKQWVRKCVLPSGRHVVTGGQMAECVWKRMKPSTTHINKSNDVAMELAIREGQ